MSKSKDLLKNYIFYKIKNSIKKCYHKCLIYESSVEEVVSQVYSFENYIEHISLHAKYILIILIILL